MAALKLLALTLLLGSTVQPALDRVERPADERSEFARVDVKGQHGAARDRTGEPSSATTAAQHP